MSDTLKVQELSRSVASDINKAATAQVKAIPALSQILSNRAPNSAARFGVKRAPFMFTRLGRKEGLYKSSSGHDFDMIYAELNPEQYSFSLGTREVLEKCGGGQVLHSYEASQSREQDLGRYLDDIPISYNMNTGNCLPVKIANGDIKIPAGLDTFYALIELLLEDPRVLDDGRPNDLIIVQSSVIFPSMTVEGKLDPGGIQGVNLDAGNPAEIRGFNFTVQVRRTVPKITSHAALQAVFVGKGNW